jgi:hypothetical protein
MAKLQSWLTGGAKSPGELVLKKGLKELSGIGRQRQVNGRDIGGTADGNNFKWIGKLCAEVLRVPPR